jgi:hypothetical protein
MAMALIPALGSCARRAEPKGGPAAPPKAPPSANAPLAPGPAKPGAPPPGRVFQQNPQRSMPPIAAKPPAPAAPLAASMRGFGLRAASVPRIARDFSLGPLQSSRPAAGEESAVYAVAKSFADGIAAGKLDRGILLPEARDALSVLLAPPAPGNGPQTAIPYRLGAIELRGPEASLLLRLPGSSASERVEGLLSLRKVGEAWYIEALALDRPVTEALAFNPDSSANATRKSHGD